MSENAEDILRSAKLVVSPETFHVVSVDHDRWQELLSDPALSPRMGSEFLIFKDKWEVTIVVDDPDFRNLRPGLGDALVEGNFRLLSFDAEMDFDVVGFIAAVSSVLAGSGISILPFSSFRRDHILVRQDDLAGALKAFRGIVREVC
ncbi:MAG: ACT domain-containing protein [Acidobacteriota bacterium]|nr:MAG: ACT domain-containing protein [Acidobacteriota bacterium]